MNKTSQTRLVVGGEFTFAPSIFWQGRKGQFSAYGSRLSGYRRYYTFGAFYSLRAIIQHLRFQPGEFVLLPSYLCPTIIEPFKHAGVNYDFYKMGEGLLPDLDDLDSKCAKGLKAVLFIDYFGFPQRSYLLDILAILRHKGVHILQDTVQAWVSNEDSLYGDFCFNSLRKFTPFEASVILSRSSMSFSTSTANMNKFLLHKRYAQLLRHLHLHYGLFEPHTFLSQIDLANASYHQEGIAGMPVANKWLLDKLDLRFMGRSRQIVYRSLRDRLAPVLVINRDLDDNVPLGMAIRLKDRDACKGRLHSLDIHCPLHWKLSEEIDKKEHEFSWELSEHELTLPLNVNLADLPAYLEKLQSVL